MPLVSIEANDQVAAINSVSLSHPLGADASATERLYQTLIAFNLEAFFPDQGFKLLATEFSAWEDSKRRIDILACDRMGSLVVIEIKREQADSHAELQALRYAALLTVLPSQIIEEESFKFQKKNTQRPSDWGLEAWRAELADHIGSEGPVQPIHFDSNRIRILLVADNLSSELLTTIDWLSKYLRPQTAQGDGVQIEYHQLSRYQVADKTILHLDKIYPLPLAEEFLVRAKQKYEEEIVAKARRPKTECLLYDAGELKAGDILVMDPVQGGQPLPEFDREVVFEGVGGYRWRKNGTIYRSLNAVYLEYSGRQGQVQAPSYIRFKERPDKSLAEIADEIWWRQSRGKN